MDDRIDLGVILDLILCLEVNRSIRRRAFFDTDRLIAGKILLFDVPQGVTVAGKADSPQVSTRGIVPCQYTKKILRGDKEKAKYGYLTFSMIISFDNAFCTAILTIDSISSFC